MNQKNAHIPGTAGCNNLPIGVFDSGVGGLTVLAALRRELPHEHLLYLGDTARLPYGTKSASTVARYAVQAAEKLVEQHVKMLVIACNTATAAALSALRETFPHIPVLGVIEPGAQAAVKASRSGRIMVIATEGTIKNGAYTKAIQALAPASTVVGVPCPLFVPIAEEGWTGQPNPLRADAGHISLEADIVRSVAHRYLHEYFSGTQADTPDCLLLGCTHFPPLAPVIAQVVGAHVTLVDSAATTALAVKETLARAGLARTGLDHAGGSHKSGSTAGASAGQWQFFTTDSPERFLRVGSMFLGATIQPAELSLVTL